MIDNHFNLISSHIREGYQNPTSANSMHKNIQKIIKRNSIQYNDEDAIRSANKSRCNFTRTSFHIEYYQIKLRIIHFYPPLDRATVCNPHFVLGAVAVQIWYQSMENKVLVNKIS